MIEYRSEIDGLRAVAVLSVLLFHAKIGLPGGFVGVDVFFVISGFLITSLILRKTEEDRFSLKEFWFARIRRIAPGFGAPFKPVEDGEHAAFIAAIVGILAAFCALLVHTIGYAAYLTDPLTWVVFAIGGVLASRL